MTVDLTIICLLTVVQIYGDTYMKYNQHWCTHIAAQIVDFGPAYGFWTFPGERINKTVKSLNTNNHRDGDMELTFLREFHRTQRVKQMVCGSLLSHPLID